MSQEDEAYALKHFGVKGMRWGVRQQRTAADVNKDLARIEKGRNSVTRKLLPASSVIAGAGARAGTAQKVLNLKAVKNPDGSTRLITTGKTPVITEANRAAFEKKIDRKTYVKYAAKGSIAVGLLLSSAYLGHTKISDPELAKLATRGALLLAGTQSLHTVSITAGVHRNAQDRQLTERKRALKKELKIVQKN